MKTQQNEELKKLVRDKYSQIALQSREQNKSSCCGAGSCTDVSYTIMADEYSGMKGYVPDADLGLGCGLPTEYAGIKVGDTVIDLGSGAGNDCFVARAITGEKGRVIGIDMTEPMIEKAKINAQKLGFSNIEFRLGEIEDIPVSNDTADVVVSNCVLNLVPDKVKSFLEIFRVMKPGGHFSISDIVLQGDLPPNLKKAGEMYAGCVSGAVQKESYLQLIKDTGFVHVKVQKQKAIFLPDDLLAAYLSKEEIKNYREGDSGIFSITVYGEKPSSAKNCCGPDCCT